MKSLPADVVPYRRTPEFTAETVPAGLLGSHQTKAGVWGLIVVLEGRLTYRILEPAFEDIALSPGAYSVVEPGVRHQVVLDGPVRFHVAFHRLPELAAGPPET